MPNQRASVPYLPTAGRMVEWIPEESTNGAGFERSSKHVVARAQAVALLRATSRLSSTGRSG